MYRRPAPPSRSLFPSRPRSARILGSAATVGILTILLMSSLAPVLPGSSVGSIRNARSDASTSNPAMVGNLGPWVPVPDSEIGAHLPGAVDLGLAGSTPLLILVTFRESNAAQLGQFLEALSRPRSPEYHHYLTAAQFDARYGGSPMAYRALINFVQGEGASRITTFADRLTLTFEATPTQIHDIFHVSIARFQMGDRQYFAPLGTPMLPASLVTSVAAVEGLSTYSGLTNHIASLGRALHVAPPTHAAPRVASAGFLAPVTMGGAQYEYAPDFQVSYDESSLFNASGFPTSSVIATILWAGTNKSGQAVGPFVPGDISAFFNETLPSGEPHPHVYGVPLNGAVAPGPSASYDASGANEENTLDLEMVGSTAPGASIYNVYGPNSTYASLDSAFAYILNPNASEPTLANVSVITNSWGGTDFNNTAWYTDLQVAQARGISVLASSGDSGDNNLSSKWVGSNAEFPSSMAYDSFGVTAVGGTTITLYPNSSAARYLHIRSQIVWNISSAYAAPGSPAGSSGGISTVFPEPSWQANSSANSVIAGAGRGVPDIAAVANNTLVTITLNGVQYLATNATNGGQFISIWGTSVASPLEAGVVAEIDHVLSAQGDAPLGFLDPNLYALANREFAPLNFTTTTGYSLTGAYNSSLPILPLDDVVDGSNALYSARFGYDLVTGWGSIDAYNYTQYFLTNISTTPYGRLAGVSDTLTLRNLAVTSYFSNGTVNTNYNASIQQNFFLADGLGAPIYWVQNVIYMTNTSSGWYLTYTGWVIFPFFGQYPSLPVYEYNFPAGQVVTFPARLNVTSRLVERPGFQSQEILFTVQNQSLTLPVPGAAYILGSLSTNYSWQGVNYSNGPYPNNPTPGGLAPQFGLVGGPSLGNGNFTSPTSGNLTVAVLPLGQTTFESASTAPFGLGVTETGETAVNEGWSSAGGSQWNLGISPGNTTQGILAYEPIHRYQIVFHESGLPRGQAWSVILNGRTQRSTSNQTSFVEPNGNYTWSLGPVPGYHTANYTGAVNVRGANVTINSTWIEETYGVQFTAKGLPNGTAWWLNVTGGSSYRSNSTLLHFSEPNGSYNYTVASSRPSFQAPGGSFTVAGAAVTMTITFSAVNYSVAFTESGLPSGTAWSLTVGNRTTNSTGSTISFSLTNGSYNWSVGLVPGYRASPHNGTVIVNGSRRSITIDWSTVTYTVTVHETGLPTGTRWSIQLSHGANYSSTTGVLNFTEPNGTYAYTLHSANPDYGGSGGNISVQGANQTVDVSFNYIARTLSFESLGLPSGTNWSVTIGNMTNSSVSSWLNFTELQGSYDYQIGGVPGWTTSHFTGRVNLSSSERIQVAWVPTTYPIDFVEQGLPNGTLWAMNLNGTAYSSNGSEIAVALTNGSYTYSFESVPGFISPSPGALTVQGHAAMVTARFEPFNFTVTVIETGLANGSLWWFNISGGPSTSSHQSTLEVGLPNGTYQYLATSNGTGYNSLNGSFTLDGSGTTLTLGFEAADYPITFRSYGLPSYTAWSVEVNGSYYQAFNTTLVVEEPNGIYNYSIQAPAGWIPQPASGQLHVDNGPLSIVIQWSQYTYPVTFQEVGLPRGTAWTVSVNGTLYRSTGTNLSFPSLNGTQSYLLGGIPGYTTNSYHGSFTVSGSSVSILVRWTQVTYSIQIREVGLASGTFWSVAIGNRSISGSESQILASEPNGTYLLIPLNISGYSVSPTSVRIVVQGGSVHESFTYRLTSSTSSASTFFGLPITPTEGYLLIVAILLVIAAAAAAAVLRGRRRSRA